MRIIYGVTSCLGSPEKPTCSLRKIYHGKTAGYLSKALPRCILNFRMRLTHIEVLVYNYAAPAKNRWGDTVYPQLPHRPAYSLDVGAGYLAK
ncbi:MAG: hypothetical protein JJE12_03030 [Anaerolineales bacterium]|nr:hypothetical protein [Anaerolineales bacterium]